MKTRLESGVIEAKHARLHLELMICIVMLDSFSEPRTKEWCVRGLQSTWDLSSPVLKNPQEVFANGHESGLEKLGVSDSDDCGVQADVLQVQLD